MGHDAGGDAVVGGLGHEVAGDEIVGGVVGAVADDPGGFRSAYSGESFEVGFGGGVEVEGNGGFDSVLDALNGSFGVLGSGLGFSGGLGGEVGGVLADLVWGFLVGGAAQEG